VEVYKFVLGKQNLKNLDNGIAKVLKRGAFIECRHMAGALLQMKRSKRL
jgi:hypothetical protein